MRGAILYRGELLAPNSHAYKLWEDQKFKELDTHMKEVNAKYRALAGKG